MVRPTRAVRNLAFLVSLSGALPLLLTAFVSVTQSGCLADATPAGQNGDPPLPGGPGPTDGEKPDAKLCVGTGATGQPCEVSADCDAPLACIDHQCVGPNDPSHVCDEVDGRNCEAPGETCAPTGVCVIVPGACTTTDQCPAGFLCHDKQCVPERDGMACLDPGPGPNLTGTWAFSSTLRMRAGLPGVLDALLKASEVLADLVEGKVNWGIPILDSLINVIVPAIIDRYIPEWAQAIPVALAHVSDVLDDLGVDSTVYLAGGTCESTYRGYSTWDKITLKYRGQVISKAPKDIPEIGAITPEEFTAFYSCGQLYIDKHRVKNHWSGLVRYVVNTVIEVATGKPTIEQAVHDAIDCKQLATAINDGLHKASKDLPDMTTALRTACDGAVKGVLAQVDDARHLGGGAWTGSVVGFDFPGSFTAQRR